jgi:hypothetical protein
LHQVRGEPPTATRERRIMKAFTSVENAALALAQRIEAKNDQAVDLAIKIGSYNQADLKAAREALGWFMEELMDGNEPDEMSDRDCELVRLNTLIDEIKMMAETSKLELIVCDESKAGGLVSPSGFHPSEGVFVAKR